MKDVEDKIDIQCSFIEESYRTRKEGINIFKSWIFLGGGRGGGAVTNRL